VAADAQKKISILVSDEDGVDPEVVRITSKRSWGILVRRPGPTREPEAFRLRESTPSLRGRVVRSYFIEPVRNYSVVDTRGAKARASSAATSLKLRPARRLPNAGCGRLARPPAPGKPIPCKRRAGSAQLCLSRVLLIRLTPPAPTCWDRRSLCDCAFASRRARGTASGVAEGWCRAAWPVFKPVGAVVVSFERPPAWAAGKAPPPGRNGMDGDLPPAGACGAKRISTSRVIG
jgi:hypothetical protein